ncbi:MAG: pyruvate ferredoxin oxidoreductase [Chloroflexi bacterium CG07_land_8_20_14_0_80_51_10]|nr:MAG: pyruvate ferredoxin oxidoreductase [Chloroflexi bacterium CG07_land_8_20_14_0_80_51_10]
MAEVTWKDIEIGNIVTEAGSASTYCTGDWRSDRPILDREKCNKCGLCWLYCPEGAIDPADEGYFEVNLYYCKGCGICAVECPKDAIKMIEEEE